MRRAHRVVGAALCLVLIAVGCSRACRKPKLRGELSEAERAVITAFTHGTISRESPIRVQFAEPQAEPSLVGSSLPTSPFAFDPQIGGVAVWTAANELEFRPAERLPDGQPYTATLDLTGILKEKGGLARFEFDFASMRQSFEVTVDGLEAASPDDIKRQKLTGRLVTADVDEAAKVEKTLAATHGNDGLLLSWSHDTDRRTHAFTVDGIVRAEEPGTLRLALDGTPIGADKKATREIAVPGLNTFSVDQARAVTGKEQYVELRFSDPLKTPQNLRGLVEIEKRDDLRFVIAGSIVQVFSGKSFRGEQKVHVAAGIRNVLGYRMREARDLAVSFEELKPQVRFVGNGVVVPTSTGLKIPVEVVNLRFVTIEAMSIPDSALPQFLQVNDLPGENELQRVGRVVWHKTLPLDITPDKENRWVPIGLDLTPLTSKYPGGMYRLRLSFKRPHVIWSCPGTPPVEEVERPERPGNEEQEQSNWDNWEEGAEGNYSERYEHRDDPCHAAYYQRFYDHNVAVARNVLISNLGLIAKAGEDGQVSVVVTALRTTAAVSGAKVTLVDYQRQQVGSGSTNGDGIAKIAVDGKAALAVVRSGDQTGYLKMDDGSALSLAHFDVAGARAPKGLKGFLYGERGVWRPGDTLHLGFILLDPTKRLDGQHPARFELINSRGQLVKTITKASSTDGFYTFDVPTSPDAPTGNYTGRVTVGGASFEKTLKIETIMPNRLKIALDFGKDLLTADSGLTGVLKSMWLHGAPAKGLKADVELMLTPTVTSFPSYADYVFDDPTRRYETEKQTIFEGLLDETGTAHIQAGIEAKGEAPGKLTANLTTRVFEPGGAFSVDRFSIPYSPYERYVGIRTPKGDRMRGMLLTDVKHVLDVVAVDPHGTAAGNGEVELKLYKVDWRWWWEHGEENLSAYAESSVHTPLQSGVVKLHDGVGSWTFEIKYPDWGRYLITAADRQGRHRTGKLIYIDWPNWAGRGQKEAGGGANVLSFAPDQQEYKVGETVTLTLPTPKKGRALVSIESGSRVLRTAWIDATGAETRYSFAATAEMTPNVYAYVTLLQPHAQTTNDLPIRMYGVAPIKVIDAATRLKPVLDCPAVFVPESTASITVREASGEAMTYTVAVVDEGLLGLTRFQTPNPWDHFYAREALGVKTWDLFDHVLGAYGAAMERMLAIGGDEEGAKATSKRANRFPPMVRFLGPFRLERGSGNTHKVDIPQYVGAVRVMVVAGRDGAYGAADKSVFVRRPLMLLATLPRVLGPQEQVALPVSVFALEPQVKEVTVSVTTSGPLTLTGPASKKVTFSTTGDQLVSFDVTTKPTLGVGRAVIRAVSGNEHAEQKIELDVRMAMVRTVDVIGTTLKAKDTWQPTVTLPGLPGTNEVTLEVSRIPPIDLGRRLEYLMQYPHGCVEQTTSAAFPQLFLGQLLELSPEKQSRIEANIKAALERLKSFQTSEGGFGYWPGDNDSNDWATNYAGHFMVEAQKAGYLVPAGLLDQWKGFQRRRARGWAVGAGQPELTQAYRLYTLALASAPELAAMNQLRERSSLPVTAKWRLAAAYQLAGQPEAARALATHGVVTIKPYRELWWTFGSDLRDRAMVLETLVTLNMSDQVGPLVTSLSNALTKSDWLSTQETAYALLALARAAGGSKGNGQTSFSYTLNGATATSVALTSPVVQRALSVGDRAPAVVVRNTGEGVIYPRLVISGLPPAGQEVPASNGLKLEIAYLTPDGKPLDPVRLEQGTDLKVVAKVTNLGVRGDLEQVALSHLFPSGWEIRNERLDLARHRPPSGLDYQDIRDDRVYSYFNLKNGETKTIEILANASYLGKYYLPMVSVEPMYDATINARVKGQWVQVVAPGK